MIEDAHPMITGFQAQGPHAAPARLRSRRASRPPAPPRPGGLDTAARLRPVVRRDAGPLAADAARRTTDAPVPAEASEAPGPDTARGRALPAADRRPVLHRRLQPGARGGPDQVTHTESSC